MNSLIATYPDEAANAQTCEVIVVPCMDFRFRKPVQEAVEQALGISWCDLRSEPGVSLTFIKPSTRLDALLADIELAIKAHQVSKVILVDHSDCGAYRMAGLQFADMGIEEGKHEENLHTSKRVIHEKFPNIEVITLYAKKHNGKIELIKMH